MISLISFVLLLKFVAPLVNGEAAIIGVAVLSPQAPFLAVGSLTFTQQSDTFSLWFISNGKNIFVYRLFFLDESLKVEGEIVNTFPNTHFSLHVHEQGDLTQGCKSVGSYFNPRRNQVRFFRNERKTRIFLFFSFQRGAQSKNEKFWTNFGTVMSNMFGHIRVSLTVSNGSLIGNEGVSSIRLLTEFFSFSFDWTEDFRSFNRSSRRRRCPWFRWRWKERE